MNLKKYYPTILFLLGFGIFMFTRMSKFYPTIPVTILIAPVFILRFIRIQKTRSGILLTLIGFILTINIALFGIFDMGGELISLLFNFIRSTLLALLYFLPYMIDRLIYDKFKNKGAFATLTFPVVSTALFFFLTIEGPFEGSYQMGKFLYGPLILKQLISLAGLTGAVFFTCWAAAVINYLWEQNFNFKKDKKLILVFSSIVILIFIYGTIKIYSVAERKTVKTASIVFIPKDGKTVKIPPLLENKIIHPYKERMEEIKEKTETAAANGAKIILFQEFAILINKEDRDRFIRECSQTARANKVYFAMNYGYYVKNGKGANILVLIDANGRVLLSYAKKYLLGIDDTVEKGVFKKGPEIIQSVDTPYGRIGLSICREIDMGKYIIQAGEQGVDIMLSPAYEWPVNLVINYGYMRGIENGFSLVRATYNGISFASDYNGKILATMPFDKNESGIMYANVPIKGVKTFYPSVGDLLGWLSIMTLLGMVIFIFSKRIFNKGSDKKL